MSYLQIASMPTLEITNTTVQYNTGSCLRKMINAANCGRNKEFVKLVNEDPTGRVLNLFYKNTVNREDITDYIINEVPTLFNMLDNDALLYVVLHCISIGNLTTFNLLLGKLNSGFYKVLYSIIKVVDLDFMKSFAKTNAKFFTKMLNSKDKYGVFSLDRIIYRIKNYDYNLYIENEISSNVKYNNTYVEFIAYMLSNGALSDILNKEEDEDEEEDESYIKTKEIKKLIYAPELAYLMKENVPWQILLKTDLVFNKIMSYLL